MKLKAYVRHPISSQKVVFINKRNNRYFTPPPAPSFKPSLGINSSGVTYGGGAGGANAHPLADFFLALTGPPKWARNVRHKGIYYQSRK